MLEGAAYRPRPGQLDQTPLKEPSHVIGHCGNRAGVECDELGQLDGARLTSFPHRVEHGEAHRVAERIAPGGQHIEIRARAVLLPS